MHSLDTGESLMGIDTRQRGEEGVSFCPSVGLSQVNWSMPQDSSSVVRDCFFVGVHGLQKE